MPQQNPVRFAGDALRRVVGPLTDIIGPVTELLNPAEPSMLQKAVNAGVVGGTEMMFTAGSRGLNAIPQVLDYSREFTPNAPPVVRDTQDCASLFNTENLTRDIATRLVSGRPSDYVESGKAQKALEACRRNSRRRTEKFGGMPTLIMPR
jgi:hypothetical protein